MKTVVIACAAVLLLDPATAADRAPAASPFDALWAEYQTAGHAAVERSIRSAADYQQIRGDLFKALPGWRRDWRPIHARFFLDLIDRATAQRWLAGFGSADLGEELIEKGREFVIGRPDKPGHNAQLDEFEVLWHRTVLAALQGNLAVAAAERYLSAIDKRVAADAPPPGVDRLVDSRLALTAALVKEEWITPDTIARDARQTSSTLAIVNPSGGVRTRVNHVLKQLDVAMEVPETAAEASVRKGFLLFRLGRLEEALATIYAREAPAGDRVVAYWRALFRGRILEDQRRPDDAVSAYEEAQRLCPDAQSPRVALASLLQRSGRREDALAQRMALGALPRDAGDPWWIYWLGDHRFVPEWLAAIRAHRP